jgi:hypothetical protein
MMISPTIIPAMYFSVFMKLLKNPTPGPSPKREGSNPTPGPSPKREGSLDGKLIYILAFPFVNDENAI